MEQDDYRTSIGSDLATIVWRALRVLVWVFYHYRWGDMAQVPYDQAMKKWEGK